MLRPMSWIGRFFYPALFICSLWYSGCAFYQGERFPFDFTEFQDGPIPEEIAVWLEGGEQSTVTPRIADEARRVFGRNRREQLFRAMRHIWQSFSYDQWLNARMFLRTADDLFESRVLGGCSDFAVVEITLFRALGIPARMVITANVAWMEEYRQNGLAMTAGHSFIEVFLEDRWFLVDSTYRQFYTDHDPDSPSYPHGEYFCKRGKDFWDVGIRDIKDLDYMLRAQALRYWGDFEEPPYLRHPI